MRTFQEFILEGLYSKDMTNVYEDYDDPKKIKEYLKNNNIDIQNVIENLNLCKKYNSKRIYRGMGYSLVNRSDFKIGDGDKLERVSANTSNYYNLILSQIIPSWKPFPRRDKSFICSTSVITSQGYGNTYLCVPLENQKIGICSESDFWGSFPYLQKKTSFYVSSMNDFNSLLKEIANELEILLPRDITDPIEFMKKMEEIYKKLKTKDLEKEFDSSLRHFSFIMLNYKTPMDFLNDIFDPDKNNFQLTTFKDYDSNLYSESEVWMSEKVLFIKMTNDHNYNVVFDKKIIDSLIEELSK